jgi:peptidoglycan/LPS O-acetylase OafA/YrhL
MGAPALGTAARSRDAMRARPVVRFEALDSWRGLAAIMVVLFHVQIVKQHPGDWHRPVRRRLR